MHVNMYMFVFCVHFVFFYVYALRNYEDDSFRTYVYVSFLYDLLHIYRFALAHAISALTSSLKQL